MKIKDIINEAIKKISEEKREKQVQYFGHLPEISELALATESFKIDPLDPADIEYIQSLRYLCAEPSIGNQYIPLVLGLFSHVPHVYGDDQTKTLIKLTKKKALEVYVFKDDAGKKYLCPTEHVTSVTYAATFLFDNQDACNKFKSALLLKFDAPARNSPQ